MVRYIEVFREFFRRWWSGPNSVASDAQREIGFCVGPMKNPMKKSHFVRRFSNLDVAFASIPFSDFKQLNLFTSVAFYPDIDLNEADVSKALYDRLYYDFDCEDNPRLAVEKAIEFVKSLKARFDCDAVVAVSGIRGAHVTIPLKKPITWRVYERLWDTLIALHSFGKLVDPQVKEPKRLCRVPYTYNIKYDDERKQVVTGFSYIIDLGGRRVRIEEFDWSSYEPLDPSFALDVIEIETPLLSQIRIGRAVRGKRRVKNFAKLPEDPAELDNCEAVPLCIRNIIHVLKSSGDPDHFQRLALVWYLRWVGYDQEAVVSLFKRFARDYNVKVTRYQVGYAFRKNYIMYSCSTMKEKGMCLDCGWNRNPVTYTYVRAEVSEEVKKMFFELVKKSKGDVKQPITSQ